MSTITYTRINQTNISSFGRYEQPILLLLVKTISTYGRKSNSFIKRSAHIEFVLRYSDMRHMSVTVQIRHRLKLHSC